MLPTVMAASYCGVTPAAWRKLDASGRCPSPIKLGRTLLWRRADLDRWITDGCPARDADAAKAYRIAKAGTLGRLNARRGEARPKRVR
ncbi:MAG: helix-turn-helix transcriptional regulator [Phycisphaerae bacterium]